VELTYDTVVDGAYTDVVDGMSIRFEDDSGNVKGYGVVRKVPTSTLLYPIPVGYNDIQFEDNDKFFVLDDYPLVSRTPRIDETNPLNPVFYKNYDLAYVDQGNEPNPKCNAGPDYINFIDPDTEVISVDFDLTAFSFPVAVGATIDAYSGDVFDGTVVDGSIASGVFTVEFPEGARYCLFTVEDSNGKTHTHKVLVVACSHDGDVVPFDALPNLRTSLSNGWEGDFTILEDDVSELVIPKNCKLLYFEDETYGETRGSLNGYTGREHVKFVGWATSDNVSIDPETSDVKVSASGPIGILRTLPGFSQSVQNATSATAWNHIKSLTLFRAIWYMLHWHTTLLDICDLERPSWHASYPYHEFDVDQNDPHTAVDTLTGFVTGKLTCDGQGIFYLRKSPTAMSDSDRNNLTTVVSLVAQDWEHIEIEERHRKQDYWLRASGLLASSTASPTPFMSIAPSTLPNHDGQQEDTFDRQLVEGQSDLNIRSGHVYAERNTDRPRHTIKIIGGGFVADPAWREWIKLTLDEETNKRQIAYSSDRFVLTDVSVNFDDDTGSVEEDWTLTEETAGVPATTVPIRVSAIENYLLTSIVPFELTVPDSVVLDQLPKPVSGGLENSPVYYITSFDGSKFLRCRNFGSGSEIWETVVSVSDLETMTGKDIATLFFMALDSWNPKLAGYLQATSPAANYYIFSLPNLDAPPEAQTAVTIFDKAVAGVGNAVNAYDRVLSSINVNGLVYAMIGLAAGTPFQNYVKRSSRGGSFVTAYADIDGSELTNYDIGKHWASATSGKAYFGSRNHVGSHPTIWKSTDGGVNYSEIWQDLGSTAFVHCVHVPYDNNPNDNVVFVGLSDRLVRINEDLSVDEIDVGGGSAVLYIHTFTGDRNFMACISTGQVIRLSEDGGDTWSAPIDNPTTGSNETDLRAMLLGWPFDHDTMVISVVNGLNQGIYWTDDLFSGSPPTWTSANGNLGSLINPIAFRDGAPVWVA